MIDDFFRLVIFTILIPVLLNAFGFGRTAIFVGLGIGALMDVYDFITEFGPGQIISKKDLNIAYIFRKRHGVLRFAFALHDLMEICAATVLISILLTWLKISYPFLVFGFALGVAIDVHDFITEFSGGRLQIKE
ncbi:hypothetical protein JXB41_01275 [Candidatus Woesearchaeota archaeon]|nr:hypothetical protein [Candidatus Woesearchaeota archaeon]